MSYKRSFGKIQERKGILGFHMVNAESEDFFIYDEPFINVCRNPNKYVRVKKRDRYPKDNRGYYQGEIYGYLDEVEIDGEQVSEFNLYFGPAEKALKFDAEGSLTGIINQHEYLFPKEEFLHFAKAIDLMFTQHRDFIMLKMNADVITEDNPGYLE